MKLSYKEEDRQKVKNSVSLTAYATSLGYTVFKKGAYYSIKEMDSIIIYNDKSWRRFSNKGNINGGSQIDFELEFGSSHTVPEAIHTLLGFINAPTENNNYVRTTTLSTGDNNDVKEFVLPPRNDNYKRLYAYLMKTRGLSQEVISYFVHNKLIYEEASHHNMVFCGYNSDGEIKYAGMRGTVTYGNTSFKCDVPGNDKNYGVNIFNPESDELKVFESVIDLMSYMDITNDYESSKLVLGMTADNPLKRFLNEHPNTIRKITFCLDNDEAGLKAMLGDREHDGLVGLYRMNAYETDYEVPSKGKDWNEYLLLKKKDNQEVSNENNEIYIRHKRR